MIRKKIKEIGTVYSGATPKTNIAEYWNGDIAWVTPREINKLNSQFLNETERYLTESGLKSCSANMLPKGSILFTSRAPIGLLAINNIEVCTNQGFKSIVLNNGFSSLYVYYFLKTQIKQLNDLGTGSTFKELSKSTFEKFEIPIPENLAEQIRIAEVLKKVETLIQQRKESIDLLDNFLRSTFFDIFGDIHTNSKKWPTTKFEKLIRLKRGYDLAKGLRKKGNVPVYASSSIIDYHNEVKVKGPGLITGRSGTIGVVNYTNLDYWPLNTTLYSEFYDGNLIYIKYFLEQFRLDRFSKGSGVPTLNRNLLHNQSIVNVPLKLQNKFASIVEKAEEVKEQYKESLEELKKLFGSLSQKAFKGELDLSKLDVSIQLREVEKKIEAESGLDISLETKLTKSMQQFIKQTADIQKRLALANNMIPKSLFKQIESINKTIEPFQELNKIPEQLALAMKSFDGIKSITSQLNQEAKEKFTTKLTWEEVNFEMVANWIKDEYSEYHFNSEILMHFLENERVTFSNYHSSEELKTNPKLNEADDIKSFVFSALKGKNQFIKLEQFFYDAVSENVQLKLRSDDYEVIKDKEKELRSGIYFKVVE